jgi:hypothetical protein
VTVYGVSEVAVLETPASMRETNVGIDRNMSNTIDIGTGKMMQWTERAVRKLG